MVLDRDLANAGLRRVRLAGTPLGLSHLFLISTW